jgi:hypothetical protein
MASAAEIRRAALDAMLARRSQGQIGQNETYFDDTIVPYMGRDMGASADMGWDARNKAVSDAARDAIGRFGDSLNTFRSQKEIEQYNDDARRRAGRGSGSRSATTTKPAAMPLPPIGGGPDPYAWVYEAFESSLPPAPSRSTGVASNESGRGYSSARNTPPRPSPPRPARGNY